METLNTSQSINQTYMPCFLISQLSVTYSQKLDAHENLTFTFEQYYTVHCDCRLVTDRISALQ